MKPTIIQMCGDNVIINYIVNLCATKSIKNQDKTSNHSKIKLNTITCIIPPVAMCRSLKTATVQPFRPFRSTEPNSSGEHLRRVLRINKSMGGSQSPGTIAQRIDLPWICYRYRLWSQSNANETKSGQSIKTLFDSIYCYCTISRLVRFYQFDNNILNRKMTLV